MKDQKSLESINLVRRNVRCWKIDESEHFKLVCPSGAVMNYQRWLYLGFDGHYYSIENHIAQVGDDQRKQWVYRRIDGKAAMIFLVGQHIKDPHLAEQFRRAINNPDFEFDLERPISRRGRKAKQSHPPEDELR